MIDPERLEKQRRTLAVVPPDAWFETRCKCGKRTTRRSGVCAKCERAQGLGDSITRMTDEQLVSLMTAARTELKRRRDELDAALNERAAPAAKETQA